MGLDISVVRTPKAFDLNQIFAIHRAVEENFNWYLGDDEKGREDMYEGLRDKAMCLNRQKILDATSEPEELVEYLRNLNPGDFAMGLAWVIGSVKRHEAGNTHLFFDVDMFPGTSIVDSCSWNLREMLLDCASDKNPNPNPNGDSVMELDPGKVARLAGKWNRLGVWLKMELAKWIGFFMPETGERIRMDLVTGLGLRDAFVDFQELEHYRLSLDRIRREIQNGDRLWLISSY